MRENIVKICQKYKCLTGQSGSRYAAVISVVKVKGINVLGISAIILIVTILILIFVTAPYFYQKGEVEASKSSDANCRLVTIAKELNHYFVIHGEYPQRNYWVSKIREQLPDIECGRLVKVVGKDILDPWGDGYCYKEKSKTNVLIYSLNLENTYNTEKRNGRTIQAFNLVYGKNPEIVYLHKQEKCENGYIYYDLLALSKEKISSCTAFSMWSLVCSDNPP